MEKERVLEDPSKVSGFFDIFVYGKAEDRYCS